MLDSLALRWHCVKKKVYDATRKQLTKLEAARILVFVASNLGRKTMPNNELTCFECAAVLTTQRETEFSLCHACMREAQDRNDATAALLGADAVLGEAKDVSSYAFKALDGALKLLNGGGK